jgi:hypothetical protein
MPTFAAECQHGYTLNFLRRSSLSTIPNLWTQVGNVGPNSGEDPSSARIGLGSPGDVAAKHGLYAQVQAADSGEQVADRKFSGRHSDPFGRRCGSGLQLGSPTCTQLGLCASTRLSSLSDWCPIRAG